MRVVYSRRAVADIAAIADFIREHNPGAALRVEGRIKRTIDYLTDNPRLGIDRPDLRMRKIGVPRLTYSIYYRVDGDTIEIIHIRDERRRPIEIGEV